MALTAAWMLPAPAATPTVVVQAACAAAAAASQRAPAASRRVADFLISIVVAEPEQIVSGAIIIAVELLEALVGRRLAVLEIKKQLEVLGHGIGQGRRSQEVVGDQGARLATRRKGPGSAGADSAGTTRSSSGPR